MFMMTPAQTLARLVWSTSGMFLTFLGPDYMSRAASVYRDDFQPGIT